MRTFGLLGAWLRGFLVGPFVFMTLGVALLFVGRLVWRKRQRPWLFASRTALTVVGVALIASCFTLTPYLIERPLVWVSHRIESNHGLDGRKAELQVADEEGRLAILVLGGGAGETMLTLESLRRLDSGLDLLLEFPGAVLVFSEGIGDMSRVVPWTRQHIRGRGVDVDRVIFEAESQSTRENLEKSRPLLEKLGRDQVVLVTGLRHMPRAYAVARDVGMKPWVVTATEEGAPMFVPEWNALVWLGGVLNEYVGIAGYKLLGWL